MVIIVTFLNFPPLTQKLKFSLVDHFYPEITFCIECLSFPTLTTFAQGSPYKHLYFLEESSACPFLNDKHSPQALKCFFTSQKPYFMEGVEKHRARETLSFCFPFNLKTFVLGSPHTSPSSKASRILNLFQEYCSYITTFLCVLLSRDSVRCALP